MTNHSHQKLKKTSSPNFILILIDDQGWNGFVSEDDGDEPGSKSDYFETPNLEKFAAKVYDFLMHTLFCNGTTKIQYSIW